MVEVEGAEKVKDELKSLSRVVSIISFGHPIVVVTTLLEDHYQSRYWHHLVIPPSVYPYTFPMFCFIEYVVTANGMFISLSRHGYSILPNIQCMDAARGVS